jgi:hypothetical protein
MRPPTLDDENPTVWAEMTLTYTRQDNETAEEVLAWAAKTGRYPRRLTWIKSMTVQTEEYDGCLAVTGYDMVVMYPANRPNIKEHLEGPDGC